MNEKLQEQLAEVVSKAIAVAEKTGDFAIDQAPDLLREFYAWAIVENIFCILVGVGVIVLGRYLPYLWMPLKKEMSDSYCDKFFGKYREVSYSNKGTFSGLSNLVFIIALIVGILVILTNVFDLLKVLVSPKLYLIEHFIDVIKTC